MRFSGGELVITMLLLFIIVKWIGLKKVGEYLLELGRLLGAGLEKVRAAAGAQGASGGAGGTNRTGAVLGIIGLIGGYILGSSILPMLSYTSWERHVVASNSSAYTSGLRGAYSETAMLGGILGAVVFGALGWIAARRVQS
jgi:hypothetical protein